MPAAEPPNKPEVPSPSLTAPIGDRFAPSAPPLNLTDFLDLPTLQEIQDSFTAVTRLTTTIRDASGNQLTIDTDTGRRDATDTVLEQLLTEDDTEAGQFHAPITVEGQELGSISISRDMLESDKPADTRRVLQELAKQLEVPADAATTLIEAAERSLGSNQGAAIQFLYLLANAIARLCYEEYHARRRVEELSVLYEVSNALSAHRDLQTVLDTAARAVAEVMQVKAVSIRLTKKNDQGETELIPRAVYNLSETYLNKGTLKVDESEMFQAALRGEAVYVENMATDPRVLFPGDAQREGLASVLCIGMVFQGSAIGTVQLFTESKRTFTHFEIKLVRAISQLLATAIENARLDAQREDRQRMARQLRLAGDVQRRMLPHVMPDVPRLDIAARYVPSMELAGDFFDFIQLENNLGIVVGDVVGKGVAASLMMASVRASLRAYAQDLYDLDEVIARVNQRMSHDTLDSEFATLWYGVVDPETLRLTYCNAGHDPPILVRDGTIHELDEGGMVVGIDAEQVYDKGLFDLETGDRLLLYTDGLPDAMNAQQAKFGRRRIEEAFLECADRSATDTVSHILWKMRQFTGLHRSFDDTTLVVVNVEAEATPPDA